MDPIVSSYDKLGRHQNFPAFSACLSRRSWSGSFLTRNVGKIIGNNKDTKMVLDLISFGFWRTLDHSHTNIELRNKRFISANELVCIKPSCKVKGNHFTCTRHFHTMQRNYIILQTACAIFFHFAGALALTFVVITMTNITRSSVCRPSGFQFGRSFSSLCFSLSFSRSSRSRWRLTFQGEEGMSSDLCELDFWDMDAGRQTNPGKSKWYGFRKDKNGIEIKMNK